MRILEYPTQSLKDPSSIVHEPSPHMFEIIIDMKNVMAVYPNAVGIAAPQVGHNERIIIVKTDKVNRVMINPTIIWCSDDMFKSAEGCLSIPKVKGNVQRHWSVKVEYIDERGVHTCESFIGFDAAVVQHEIDHLNGILFTDRLTGSDKKKADKKLNKRK